jgi:hypothetical protein
MEPSLGALETLYEDPRNTKADVRLAIRSIKTQIILSDTSKGAFYFHPIILCPMSWSALEGSERRSPNTHPAKHMTNHRKIAYRLLSIPLSNADG